MPPNGWDLGQVEPGQVLGRHEAGDDALLRVTGGELVPDFGHEGGTQADLREREGEDMGNRGAREERRKVTCTGRNKETLHKNGERRKHANKSPMAEQSEPLLRF